MRCFLDTVHCVVPKGLSLSMKMCAQRMEGRTKRARGRFASLPFPSLGPLHFVTSLSRFVLASVQKAKRLRRKRQHCSCEIQRAVHSPLLFNLYIWASHAWAAGERRRESERLLLAASWLTRAFSRGPPRCPKKVETHLCSLIPQRFQGWHSLEKSLNFRGSLWKVLEKCWNFL